MFAGIVTGPGNQLAESGQHHPLFEWDSRMVQAADTPDGKFTSTTTQTISFHGGPGVSATPLVMGLSGPVERAELTEVRVKRAGEAKRTGETSK
jgi:hypothetical protein